MSPCMRVKIQSENLHGLPCSTSAACHASIQHPSLCSCTILLSGSTLVYLVGFPSRAPSLIKSSIQTRILSPPASFPGPNDSAAPSRSFFFSSSSRCNSYPAPSVPTPSRPLARSSQPSVSFLSPSPPQNSCYLIMFSRKLHLHSVYLQVLKFCHASLKVLTFQFRLNYSVAHFQPNSSFLRGQLSRHWSPNSLQV